MKINFKWITSQNEIVKTIKLLKQNIQENHSDLHFSKHYLNRIQKARTTQKKIDKLDLIKILNVCFFKRPILKQMEVSYRLGEVYTKQVSDKGLVLRINTKYYE